MSFLSKLKVKSNKAFTLLELLTVISLIVILAALLLPVLNKAKDRAQRIHCISNLHQLGIALNLYVSDNQKYPRYGPIDTLDRNEYWDNTILPFVSGNTKIYHCPKLTDQTDDSNWIFLQHGYHWIAQPNRSYGYNAFGTVEDMATEMPSLSLSPIFFQSPTDLIKESAVIIPSDLVAMADYNILADDDGDGDLHPDLLWSLTYTGTRHQNGIGNAVFCDAHCESDKTNTLKSARIRWNSDHQPHLLGY